jgi:hypothetical protein
MFMGFHRAAIQAGKISIAVFPACSAPLRLDRSGPQD